MIISYYIELVTLTKQPGAESLVALQQVHIIPSGDKRTAPDESMFSLKTVLKSPG